MLNSNNRYDLQRSLVLKKTGLDLTNEFHDLLDEALYGSDQFWMFGFKIKPCLRSGCQSWISSPFCTEEKGHGLGIHANSTTWASHVLITFTDCAGVETLANSPMLCLSTGCTQQSIALDGAMLSCSEECAFLHTRIKSSGIRLCTLGTMSEGLGNGNGSCSCNPILGWRWEGHIRLLLECSPIV
ncbi:hypothetical protein Adt_12041 [Abeliophyllum distichum]|uniref:Uncharacterized protein n=1 Tax=Abeliophyllum distichum TaxID=126358 RepID=A0ABD1UPV7_9LAMI